MMVAHEGLDGCFIATALLTRKLLVRRNRQKIAASGDGQVANMHAFDVSHSYGPYWAKLTRSQL